MLQSGADAHQRHERVEQRPQQACQDGRAGRDDGNERGLEQLVAVEGHIPAQRAAHSGLSANSDRASSTRTC